MYYAGRTIEMARIFKHPTLLNALFLTLSQCYQKLGDHKNAFNYLTMHIHFKDSLNKLENVSRIENLRLGYEFNQKFALANANQEKKDILSAIELQKQKNLRNSFIIGFILVFALGIVVFRGYRNKQKANIIIMNQKLEVEHQKSLVEEKQKDIIDSIHYAKRIQTSLLPTQKYIAGILNKRMQALPGKAGKS